MGELAPSTNDPLQANTGIYRLNADFQLEDQRDFGESKYDTCIEILEDLSAQGYRPVFSIPRKFLVGKTKLSPNKTWIQDKVLAGTIGIPPYNPEGDRILCVYMGDIRKIALKPRLTGPESLFRGVVATLQDIPLAECELIDTKTNQKTTLIEINTAGMDDAQGARALAEKNEKLARKAELDAILQQYEPKKLMEYLGKYCAEEYQTPLGIGFRNFTIGDHTMRVLVQFEKYFKDEKLPEPMTRDFFRLFLALHDIGKKQSIESGKPDQQADFNKVEIQKILEKFGFSTEMILLAKAMVGFDPVGAMLKSKNPKETAELQWLRIQECASQFKMPPNKFYEMMKIYYMSDASAYTSDARFPAMLDEIFEFDKQYGQIYLSGKAEEKLEALEELVH